MARTTCLFLTLLSCASTGCVGVISSFDGTRPLKPSLTRAETRWSELGGGPGGVLLRHPNGRAVLATASGLRALEAQAPPAGVRVAGDSVYRLASATVVRQRVRGPRLEQAETLAEVDGAYAFAVALRGDEPVLAVAAPGTVYAVERGRSRALWEGRAFTVALDLDRGSLWVAGAPPLAVVDEVRLADGEVVTRIPLPVELESAGLTIVPNGDHLALYATDRAIEAAVLVSLEHGRAVTLGNPGLPSIRLRAGTTPRLIEVPGVQNGERVSVLGVGPTHRGRLAPLADGRFLAVWDADWRALSFAVVSGPSRDGGLVRATVTPEEPFPELEALFATDGKVVCVSGQKRLVVDARGRTSVTDPHGFLDGVRRGTNYVLAGPLAATELVVSVTAVTAGIGLLVGLLPVWFPLVAVLCH